MTERRCYTPEEFARSRMDWLTSTQARKVFGLKRHWLYYQIECGRLLAMREDGRLLVSAQDVRALLDAPLFVDALGRRFYSKPSVAPLNNTRTDCTIAIRFVLRERAQVEAAAKSCGQTLSDFCRVAINEAVADLDDSRPLTVTGRARRVSRECPRGATRNG